MGFQPRVRQTGSNQPIDRHRNSHDLHLRPGFAPNPRQPRPHVALELHRAHGRGVPHPFGHRARRFAPGLGHHLPPQPPTGQRAGAGGHWQERHGGRDAAQHAAHGGGAFRHPDGRSGAQCLEHPFGPRDHRLHAGPRRSQGGDRGPRVFGHPEKGAGAASGQDRVAGDRCGGCALHRGQ